jgi:hypothetical protein
MNDKTTKALLFAIALGLWANAAASLLRPAELHASQTAAATERTLREIGDELHQIGTGVCVNRKIC